MAERRIRIVGLTTTERSLLAHLLEEHGFQILGDPPWSGADRHATIEAADVLTTRQCEVLSALRHSGSVREAARSLGISCRTAQAHLENIHARLGVMNHRLAVCWACERGLLTGPSRDSDE